MCYHHYDPCKKPHHDHDCFHDCCCIKIICCCKKEPHHHDSLRDFDPCKLKPKKKFCHSCGKHY